MARRPGRKVDGLTRVALGALAGVVGVSVLGWMGGLSAAGVAVLQLIVAGVAAAVLVGQSLGRRAQLARLESAARRMLTADAGEPVRERADLGSRFWSGDADTEGLREALDELGRRLTGQTREVAKKSRNLEALIAAIDEPILATDNDERVLLCNRSAESVFGGAEEGEGEGGVVGRRIDEVFTHVELLEMHAQARAGQVRRLRVPLVTPTGRRVFQVSASPLPLAWGSGVFGAVMMLRDVTELDQAVQVKTEFVANASHELRTPVAAIRSAAETLEAALPDDPEMVVRVSKMIVAHAGRLEDLLRDLLDLSRLETPDLPLRVETMTVEEIERALTGAFEAACHERSLRLVFDADEDAEVFRTDRKLLMLILRNLVENATKFASEGTDIRVSAIVLEAEVPGRGAKGEGQGVVRWEVTDKGIGIPLNQQDRVFERFYQADAARTGSTKRGTGLGLSIVKHAAKALRGRVGLKSVWGQGTTVWVEIPVEFPADAADGSRRAG